MSVYDIAITSDGTDINFSKDALITGIDEYRQAVLYRLQNNVTFINLDYGLDLAGELGKVDTASTLGLRASAAIMNDERFTATLTGQSRTNDGIVESISLAFDVLVDETQETFSLAVLIENGEVRLVP